MGYLLPRRSVSVFPLKPRRRHGWSGRWNTGGDTAQCSHAAGNDDHGIVLPGAGSKGRIKILLLVAFYRQVFILLVSQFDLPYFFCIFRHHQCQFLPLVLTQQQFFSVINYGYKPNRLPLLPPRQFFSSFFRLTLPKLQTNKLWIKFWDFYCF